MRGIDGVADAALDLRAEDERVKEVAAGDRLQFRQRENRGRDEGRRMNDGLEVRVVEVQDVELMPFMSDTVSASIRSDRPSTVAWGGPANGASAAIAWSASRGARRQRSRPS